MLPIKRDEDSVNIIINCKCSVRCSRLVLTSRTLMVSINNILFKMAANKNIDTIYFKMHLPKISYLITKHALGANEKVIQSI